MRTERLEQQGILTPDQLFSSMVDARIPGEIASKMSSHEAAHANADEEKKGYFGFRVSAGWIVAYYLIIGDRTPEQMMKIAEAPGHSEMSEQDWRIYKDAWGEYVRDLWLAKLEEEWKNSNGDNLELDPMFSSVDGEGKKSGLPSFVDFSRLSEKSPLSASYSRGELLEFLADKLDEYVQDAKTPSLKELLGSELGDFWRAYGETITDVYNEVLNKTKSHPNQSSDIKFLTIG